jgi:hypothetical protein
LTRTNPDDLGKYLIFRRGNNHVNFDLFQNYVYFNENKRELVIEVDGYKGIRTPECICQLKNGPRLQSKNGPFIP